MKNTQTYNRFSNFMLPINLSLFLSPSLFSFLPSLPPFIFLAIWLGFLLLLFCVYCLFCVMYSSRCLGFITEWYERSLLLCILCFSIWQALFFEITKNIECISKRVWIKQNLLGNGKHELSAFLVFNVSLSSQIRPNVTFGCHENICHLLNNLYFI